MENQSQIVANKSKAYGYNYASLGDIALQGFTIPKMRIRPTEFGQFIEYKDENGEWQTGAQIVVPAMKGSNEAQAYGSALTYARRYTTQMALGLVCDEDKKLEKAAPSNQANNYTKQTKTAPQNVSQCVQEFNAWMRDNSTKKLEVHEWCKAKFGEGYALTEEVAQAALEHFVKHDS